eukprot:gene659-1111_t
MVLGGLNDLEAKIAALEAALQHDAPASENSEDESSDGDGQGTEESEDELPTIPPLPLSCLPPPKSSEIVVKPDGTIKKQRRKKKKSLFEDEDDGTKDAHEGEEVFFSCEMSFDTKEELEEHRLTASHKEHARRERELSFCAACNKSFTSPEQLQVGGKGDSKKTVTFSAERVLNEAVAFGMRRNDAMVRYTGCCDNNTLPHCTDSITTDDQDQCIGADYVFNIWAAEINRCEMVGSIAGYELAYKDAVNDITCLSALGCSASSTLCTYGSHGHFRMHDEAPKFLAPRGTGRKRLKKKDRRSSAQEAEEAASLLDKAFPSEMMRAVFNFFGMEACTKGAKGKVGLFTQTPDHRHWCSCPRDGTFRGRYCLKEDAEQAGDANRTLGGSKMHSMNGTQRVHNRKSENEAHRMNDTHSANNTEQGADKTQTNAHNREQGARTLNGGQSAKDV